MTFKKNITITIACIVTECLLSLIPSIVIIYIFFIPEKLNELFNTLLFVPYFILIINALLILVSLISRLFIKTKFYINPKKLVIQNEGIKEIYYNQIAHITYDLGDILKFNFTPSKLVLFDKYHRELFSINNPSILMVHMLKKKCQNARMNYYHNKRFLFFLALVNGIVLLIALIIKVFK